MSNLLAAMNSRGTAFPGVRTEVTGVLADSPARFVEVELSVSADSGDPTALEKLTEIAERGCIMTNTLRGKLELTVRVAVPAVRSGS